MVEESSPVFEALKREIEEKGLPLQLYRNQDGMIETLRVDRRVGYVIFNPAQRDANAGGKDLAGYYGELTNDLLTITGESSCFTFGFLIENGESKPYWFTKDIPFDDPTLKGKLGSLGLNDPEPDIDPFVITSRESMKAVRVVKGAFTRHGFGLARGFASFVFKMPDHNVDMYELFNSTPHIPPFQGLVERAVAESRSSDLLYKGRFLVTLQMRKVKMSMSGVAAVAATYKIGETDPKKKAGINQQQADSHMVYVNNMGKRSSGGGFLIEMQVMLIYPKTFPDEVARDHLRFVSDVIKIVNSATYVDRMGGVKGSSVPRAKLTSGFIDPVDAVRFYVSGTFYKGKDEEFKFVDWRYENSLEYSERYERRSNDRGHVTGGTDGFNDRAVAIPEVGYFWWVAGPTAVSRMSVYNGPGGLVVLPQYLSCYNRVFRRLPKDINIFAHLQNDDDVGYDPRFIAEQDYKDIMNRAHLRKYFPPRDIPSQYSDRPWDYLGYMPGTPYRNRNNVGGAIPAGAKDEDGPLPKLKEGDVVKLFDDGSFNRVARQMFTDEQIVAAVKRAGEHGEVTGPVFEGNQGFRAFVAAGSGGGKSTMAVSAALSALEEGATVVMPDFSGDTLEKILKIAIHEYGRGNRVLDKIAVVSVGDDKHPSTNTFNLLHLPIPDMNKDLLWDIISAILYAGRETLFRDSFAGPKIQQYVKAAVQALFTISLKSTMIDVKALFDDPKQGKEFIREFTVESSGKRDSAVESLYTALDQKSRDPRSSEFDSSKRAVDTVMGSGPLKRMLNDRDSMFDFTEWMRPDKPRIIILYFPSSVIGSDESAPLAAAYIILLYKLKMVLNNQTSDKSFPDPLHEGRSLTYRDGKLLIIADEFQLYWNNLLKEAVTNGRKENISTMLLTQDFRVRDLDGSYIYTNLKSSFNYKFVRGISNYDDLKFLGFGNESTYDKLLKECENINRRIGSFLMESRDGLFEVTTLYKISEHDPDFLKSSIDVLMKHYEELDAKDGLGRVRMLSDRQLEEMTKPIGIDEIRRELGVLFGVYCFESVSEGVSLGELQTLLGKLSTNAQVMRNLKNKKAEVNFPMISERSDTESLLRSLSNKGYVRKETSRKGVNMYSITSSGVEFLERSLGTGDNAGGPDHRQSILKIAQNLVYSSYVAFTAEKRDGMVYAFPNFRVQEGADIVINASELKLKTANGNEVMYIYGEVQEDYRRDRLIKKINYYDIGNGWMLAFYVPRAELVDFKKGLSSITNDDLVDKNVSVLDWVRVEAIENVSRTYDTFMESIRGSPFEDNGGMGVSGNAEVSNPSYGGGDGSRLLSVMDTIDALAEKGDDVSKASRKSLIDSFGLEEVADVNSPFDSRKHRVVRSIEGGTSNIISRMLRPGFMKDGKVLRLEEVEVYRGEGSAENKGAKEGNNNSAIDYFKIIKALDEMLVKGDEVSLAARKSMMEATGIVEVADKEGFCDEERHEVVGKGGVGADGTIEKMVEVGYSVEGKILKKEKVIIKSGGGKGQRVSEEGKLDGEDPLELNWKKITEIGVGWKNSKEWPPNRIIKGFDSPTQDVSIKAKLACDVILSLDLFLNRTDPSMGEKFIKYTESGKYLAVNVGKLVSIAGRVSGYKKEGLRELLEGHLAGLKILVKLSDEELKTYADIVDQESSYIWIIDPSRVNEYYCEKFRKDDWKAIYGRSGEQDVFVGVSKLIEKFG